VKPHVRVTLRSNRPAPSLAAWPEMVHRPALQRESLLPDLDRLFRKWGLSSIATRSARRRPRPSVPPRTEGPVTGRFTSKGGVS